MNPGEAGMGIARLLAKGWLLFCLVAGGHALHLTLATGMAPANAWLAISVCVLLFAAMGLLFIGGFGVSGGLPPSKGARRCWPGSGRIILFPASTRSSFSPLSP